MKFKISKFQLMFLIYIVAATTVACFYFPFLLDRVETKDMELTAELRAAIWRTASLTFDQFNALNKLATQYPIVMLLFGILIKEVVDWFKHRKNEEHQARFLP